MGAADVALGSRFLFMPKCMFSDDMKRILLDAGLNTTERSHIFDEMNRTVMWLEGVDGCTVANDILVDYRQELDLEERLKRYDEGKTKAQKERLVVRVGVGIAHVSEIKSAHVVLQEVHEGAVAALNATSSLLE